MTPQTINRLLYQRYGDLDWWPAGTPYEVMAGAVLTQNTAWGNVEKAIARFEGSLAPERVEVMPMEELTDIIRPAGFYNQKAAYLKTLTAWFWQYGYSAERAKERGPAALREELLARLGCGPRPPLSYDEVQAWFEGGLPPETSLYNNLHAMIVMNAKEHCRAKPLCKGCPLDAVCQTDKLDGTARL